MTDNLLGAVLFANMRIALKILSGANNLAYFSGASVTKKKVL